jgi:SAM-dependent methyltransferase
VEQELSALAAKPHEGVPPISYDVERLNDPNMYRTTFGHLPPEAWLEVLERSVSEPVIGGVPFPTFPDPDLQRRIQGSDGVEAIREAFAFYRFVRRLVGEPRPGERFLDFGAGWGRILRPFLRDYDLKDIYAFEPDATFRTVARSLNPYVTVLSGDYRPSGRIPAGLDLVVGYSVFSHLSLAAAEAWIAEFATLLRPGGCAVFTTWGARFLDLLAGEQRRAAQGAEIHWFHRHVLGKAGDLEARRREARGGAFLWFDMGLTADYGQAFLPPGAIRDIIDRLRLPLELVAYDAQTLPQDAFLLRRVAVAEAGVRPPRDRGRTAV